MKPSLFVSMRSKRSLINGGASSFEILPSLLASASLSRARNSSGLRPPRLRWPGTVLHLGAWWRLSIAWTARRRATAHTAKGFIDCHFAIAIAVEL